MEVTKNKRSKRKSFTVSFSSGNPLQPPQIAPPAWREETRSRDRDEHELDEKMDKFYSLLGRIKAMEGLWRQGSENKRVKPVLEPVWQPTFSIEDFVGVEKKIRETEQKGQEKEKERREMERPEKGEGKREEKEKEIQKEYQKKSEEMKWHEAEHNDLDLNLFL